MSFSSKIKEELSAQSGGAKHCQMAELSAILMMCGEVQFSADGRCRIRLSTENAGTVRKYCYLVYRCFRVTPEIRVRRNRRNHDRYSFGAYIQDNEAALEILKKLKILKQDGSLPEEQPIGESVLLKKECCRRAYLRGAFQAAGSVSDPNHSYHFEIFCSDETQAGRIRELICGMEIDARMVQRKKYFVVYVKEGDQISDLLGYMGARMALLDLENVRILRGMRGNINRQVNCETANINKTASAAVRQIEDITYIRDTVGFTGLNEGLDEIARVRLQYPTATLKELGLLLDPPVGKSGVNHRLRKLSEYADRLRARGGATQ